MKSLLSLFLLCWLGSTSFLFANVDTLNRFGAVNPLYTEAVANSPALQAKIADIVGEWSTQLPALVAANCKARQVVYRFSEDGRFLLYAGGEGLIGQGTWHLSDDGEHIWFQHSILCGNTFQDGLPTVADIKLVSYDEMVLAQRHPMGNHESEKSEYYFVKR